MSKASMSEVFAGRRGPASLDRLLWLVRALLSYDHGEEVKPPERRDPQLQVWRDRWRTLESVRAAVRRASSAEDMEKVQAVGREPAETSWRLEGVEPSDIPVQFGRHPRRSASESLRDLTAPPSTTAGDGTAAAARPEAAPPSQKLIPTQQLQAPLPPDTSLTAPQLPRRFEPVGGPLTSDSGEVSRVAFSPDGRFLAVASGNVIRLWDPVRRTSGGAALTVPPGEVYSVAFSPDGRLVAASSSDGTLRVWDAVRRTLNGEADTVPIERFYSVAFSPDGLLLATGSADGKVQVWDAARRTPVGDPLTGDPLTGHTEEIYSVAFSPDGLLLATGSADGT
ncbi:WD40 repeat domain-containing protein, partial [Streptomyces mirabilis]|uniref:WD40 repeat domain-containing protein n=1 Tax=Streptomyces mirabilis TaxID=68239 RepID=UPI0036A33282